MNRQSTEWPVAIGGLGGSGTRLVAEIVKRSGFFLGECLNEQNDNLHVTLLLKRPAWYRDFPMNEKVLDAIRLFDRSVFSGLRDNLSFREKAKILKLAHISGGAVSRSNTESYKVAMNLIRSESKDLSRHSGWGWKEPNTHIFLEHFAQIYPEMRYIHVVRHGLDMVLSSNQQQCLNWGAYVCGDLFAERPMSPAKSLDYWIEANKRAIALGNNLLRENFLMLNYDRLCVSPKPVIKELLAFLDVELSAAQKRSLEGLIAPCSIGRRECIDQRNFSRSQLRTVQDMGFEIE